MNSPPLSISEQDAVIPLCSLPWNSCKQLEFNISWISEPNAHEYSPAVLRVTITKKHAGEMHSTLFSPVELRIPKKLPSMYIMLNSPTFSDKVFFFFFFFFPFPT